MLAAADSAPTSGRCSVLAPCSPYRTSPLMLLGAASRKCYYPGALSLYTELDRCFARRHQPALHRLRMAQRQHPMVLPGAALAAPVPASVEGVGVEEDVAGGSPRAEGGAEHTPPAEPISEHQFAGGAGRADSDNWLGQEVEATTAVAQAAPEGRQLSVSGDRPSHPIPVPQQQHGSSSLRRPPRSPRPGLAPTAAASRRPLAMSPQSSRQLPVGEPLMSPLGTSPPSSSGMLGLEDGAGSSLAGSTWGGSSLGTTQPRGALGSGATELADTLTSRLRPLVTSGASQPAQPFAQQQRSDYEWMSPQPLSPVAAPHQEGSNLVFLSARPESYKVRLLADVCLLVCACWCVLAGVRLLGCAQGGPSSSSRTERGESLAQARPPSSQPSAVFCPWSKMRAGHD